MFVKLLQWLHAKYIHIFMYLNKYYKAEYKSIINCLEMF